VNLKVSSLGNKHPNPELQSNLQDNLNFMAEMIHLWAALCRGANSDVIKTTTSSEIGLDKTYCIRFLEDPEAPPILKSAILNYFQAVFVGQSELTRISLNPYRCFPQQKLHNLDLSERIYFMMQNKDTNEPPSENEDLRLHLSGVNEIHNLSLRIIKEVLCDIPDRLVFPNQTLEQSQKGDSRSASLDSLIKSLDSSKKEVLELLSLQTSLFNFLGEQIDLGIAEHSLIKSGLEAAAIIIKSEIHLDQEATPEQLSLLVLLYYCSQRKETSSKYFLLIESALNLIKVVGKCRLHYQVCAFLKLISMDPALEKSEREIKPPKDQLINDLLCIYPLSSSDPSISSKRLRFGHLNQHIIKLVKAKSLSFQSHDESKREVSEDMSVSIDNNKLKQEEEKQHSEEVKVVVPKNLLEQKMPIDMILAESIFSEKDRTRQNHTALIRSGSINLKEGLESLQNSFLKREIEIKTLRLLVSYFHQRVTLGNYLADIELYHGEEEEQIFHKLSTNPKARVTTSNLQNLNETFTKDNPNMQEIETEDLSAPNLMKLISELLNPDFSQISDIILTQSPKVENLMGFFEQVESKLSNQLSLSKQFFRKTQNLMRNLDYHTRTISLLDPHRSLIKRNELFQKCMSFLRLFSLYNPQNQMLLAQKLNLFLALVTIDLDVSELTSAVLQSSKTQVHALRFINDVFNFIRRTLNSGHGGSYLYLQKTLNRIDNGDKSLKDQQLLISKDLERLTLYMKILSGLILDEIGRPRSELQIRILDSIINSPDITRIYEPVFFSQVIKLIQKRNTGNPQTTPKEDIEFYKLYSNCLSLIGELSRVQKDGVRIANRISDLPFLREALNSKNTPLLFKKQLLKWFEYFHFEQLTQTPVDRSDESFQEKKDEIMMCLTFIQEDLSHEAYIKPNSSQKSGLILVDSFEYWYYLGFTTDHEKQRYGLLYFLFSVLRAVARYKLIDTEEQAVVEKNPVCTPLKKIRTKLLEIIRFLGTNEELAKKQELPQVKMMICECILKIPIGKIDLIKDESPINNKRFRYDKKDERLLNIQQLADQYFDPMLTEDEDEHDLSLNEVDENNLMRRCLTKLVNKTRYMLVTSRRTFEEAINYIMFCTTGDRRVGLQELIKLNDATIIHKAFECLTRTDMYSVSKIESKDSEFNETDSSAFLSIMKRLEFEIQEYKIIEIGTVSVFAALKVEDKRRMPPNSSTVDKSLAAKFDFRCKQVTSTYIDGFLNPEALDEEVVPWVQIMRDKIALFDKEQEVIYFLQNILIRFVSTEHTHFLMRSFCCFLSKGKPQGDPDDEATHQSDKIAKAFVWLQNLLCKSEVPALCVAHINRDADPRLLGKCCSVLSLLLMNGNFKVQKTVHDILQENVFTKSFFEYIRERLLQPYDRESGDILNHAGHDGLSALQEPQPNSAKHAPLIDILLMLKYFCDNCYIDFQVASINPELPQVSDLQQT